MRIKQSLSLLAAGLLMAACSSEIDLATPTLPDNPGTEDDGRTEVLLTLKNTLNLKPQGTRTPIATDEENYISGMNVYVFGSPTEAGPYTFQEMHYYRDDAEEVTLPGGGKAFSFNLTPGTEAGAEGNTTNGLLKINKGLFIKIYCVANRTKLYQTDPGTGAVTEYTAFTPLLQTAPGQAANVVTPGVPTEEDFKKLHTQLINPTGATEDDILTTPLPMTGANTTPLDLTDFGTAARMQVSLKLWRMVARFDIRNDASKSKFTIKSVSMSNGQHGASFFPIKTLVTDPTKLITYPVRLMSPETQKTPDAGTGATNLTRGAFYSWPSPKDDKGYLILKGSYAPNLTDVQEVAYKIPFEQMVNGVGSYIEVAYNHRYTISITDADQDELQFTFKVDDWAAEEDLADYEPDNSFDKNEQVKLDALQSTGAYVTANGKVSLMPQAGSKFEFTMGSNAPLGDKLIFEAGSSVWLKKVKPVTNSRATSLETVYGYEIIPEVLDAPEKMLPVRIQLKNLASGKTKEITVFPTPGPELSLSIEEGNKSTYDAQAKSATMEAKAGNTINLLVKSESRTTVVDGAPVTSTGCAIAINAEATWLTADVASIATEEGHCVLTLGAGATADAEATVTFTSAASGAKTVVKVKLVADSTPAPAPDPAP